MTVNIQKYILLKCVSGERYHATKGYNFRVNLYGNYCRQHKTVSLIERTSSVSLYVYINNSYSGFCLFVCFIVVVCCCCFLGFFCGFLLLWFVCFFGGGVRSFVCFLGEFLWDFFIYKFK